MKTYFIVCYWICTFKPAFSYGVDNRVTQETLQQVHETHENIYARRNVYTIV